MRFEEYTGNEVDNPNAKLAILNPFRYRSYYYDSETNLYYLNSRYYDPELGRFINADDISVLSESQNFINGLNLYSYCNNNPINNIDDNGYAWWHWLVAALIVAAAAVALVLTAGGAAAAIGAVAAFVTTGAAATLGTTIAAGAFVGSFIVASSIAISAGIESFKSGSFDTFLDYGEEALISTLTGGLLGGVTGYVGYKVNNSFVGEHTPGKLNPYSTYKNTKDPKDITVTHYNYKGQMSWSKHLSNHGYQGHASPHWHLELPHSGPYNTLIEFVVEYLRGIWWLK